MVGKHQPQNGDQHQQPAGLGINEKLSSRADASYALRTAMAPQSNQEIHRHQHQFPEEEEQEQVDGQKHPNNAGENPQQVEMEEANSSHNFFPRTQHRQRAEKTGQSNQHQRQSIQGKMKVDAKPLNPD